MRTRCGRGSGRPTPSRSAASAALLAEFSGGGSHERCRVGPGDRTAEEIETVSATNRMLCFPYTLLMVAQPHHRPGGGRDRHELGDGARARCARRPGRPRVGRGGMRRQHRPARAGPTTTARRRWRRRSWRPSTRPGRAAPTSTSPTSTAATRSCPSSPPRSSGCATACPVRPPAASTRSVRRRTTTPCTPSSSVASGDPQRQAPRARLRNGEIVTKHHAVVLADRPHEADYVGTAEPLATSTSGAPRVVDDADGPAVVETYTVEHAARRHPDDRLRHRSDGHRCSLRRPCPRPRDARSPRSTSATSRWAPRERRRRAATGYNHSHSEPEEPCHSPMTSR